MKKFFNAALSLIITAALLISCVPAVFAEETAVPSVFSAAPTPQIIYAALNGFTAGPDGALSYQPQAYMLKYPDGTPISASDILKNADGDINEGTLVAIISDLVGIITGEQVPVTDESAEEMLNTLKNLFGDPLNLYTALDRVIEMAYDLLKEATAEDADSFEKLYPTLESFKLAVAQKLFGGNAKPSPETLLAYAAGVASIDADGHIIVSISGQVTQTEEFEGDEYEVPMYISDAVTERGRILAHFDDKNYGSVYEQLVGERENITAVQAFAIMSGYYVDPFGNLCTTAPRFDGFVSLDDKTILRHEDIAKVLKSDGTIAPSGKTYAEALAASSIAEFGSTLAALPAGLRALVQTVVPYDEYVREITESCADAKIPTFEEYRDIYDEDGVDESDLRESYDYYVAELLSSLFRVDSYGRVASSCTYGYLLDAEGRGVNISQIMNPQTGALVDGGTIFELLDNYIASLGEDLSVPVAGDANGDGKLNVSDVIVMLKQIAGWKDIGFDDKSLVAADVNDDGEISIADCIACLKKIANWDIYLVG